MTYLRSLIRVVRARQALWYYNCFEARGDVRQAARALARYHEIQWGD